MAETKLNVIDLSPGRKVTLSVKALINCSVIGDEETTNCTLMGQEETVSSYTIPGSISNLTLDPSHESISATWNPPENNSYSYFSVILQLEGSDERQISNVKEKKENFEGLKTAANYTVSVSAVSGNFSGQAVIKSVFTLPLPPTDLTVSKADKTSLTLNWKAPVGAAAATYIINISSTFWSYSNTTTVKAKTSHTFRDLKSGTKYTIYVQMEAGGKLSEPKNVSHFTVSDTREVGLSMLCSSDISLHCDNSATREKVFQQFKNHLRMKLGDSIFWELEKQNT